LQKQIFAVSYNSPPAQPVVRACCIKRPPVFTSRCCKLVSDHSRLPAARAVASGDGFHQHAENMGVAVIKAGTPIKMVIYAMSLAGDPATPGARR
jgi:hypothetical protein